MFLIRYYEMGEVIAEEYALTRQSAKHKARTHTWSDYGDTESQYGRCYEIIDENEEEEEAEEDKILK